MKSRSEFLQLLWNEEIDSHRSGFWIDNCIREYERDPNSPFADVGRAMKKMRALGVADTDIEAIGRGVSFEAIMGVLYKLGDPGVENVDLLFEELLTADPSGKDGRPDPVENSD